MKDFSSSSITNLAKAMLAAQEQLRPVAKDASNPFLKNRYASLVAVLDVVRRPLLDNGILLVQRVVESEPGTAAVETRLIHVSGEWIAGTTTIPLPEAEPGNKANLGQQVGAAISYARRYGLMSMLSLAAVDEDTDNEVRTQPQQHQFRQAQTASAQPPMINAVAKASYPGLPDIPDISYEEGMDTGGNHIVVAKGATLQNKSSLKKVGFRWSPEKKIWWIAA